GRQQHQLRREPVLGGNGFGVERLAVGAEVLDQEVAVAVHGVSPVHVRPHISTGRKLEPTPCAAESFLNSTSWNSRPAPLSPTGSAAWWTTSLPCSPRWRRRSWSARVTSPMRARC